MGTKRSSPSDDSSPKRTKNTHDDVIVDEDPFPVGLERNANDLLHTGADGTGYLCGRLFMAWQPINRRLRVLLEIPSQKYCFEVEFAGVCADFFDILQLKPHDDVLLALKGARVEKITNTSRTCNLPMKLQYVEGVIIKFARRGGSSQMVNTWRLKELAQAPRKDEDDWFSTPRDTLPSFSPPIIDSGVTERVPLVAADPETSRLEVGGSHADAQHAGTVDSGLSTVGPHVQPQHPIPETSLVQSDPSKPAHPSSKKQQRKLAKIKRKRESAAPSRAIPALTPAVKIISAEPIRDQCSDQDGSSSLPPPQNLPSERVVVSEQRQATPAEPAVPSFSPGLTTETDVYRPLKPLGAGAVVHLIGVVTSITSPSTTKTGDLMCNINIVDPSNASDDMMSRAEGFKINCFTKRYAEWLPQPNLGEVIILRNVKVKSFDFGTNGVGYHGQLRWAIYSPTTGKIRHGDMGNAPESECLGNGFGYNFTPFFQPGGREIRYCLRISDWWLELQKKRQNAMGEVHQIGGVSGEIFSFSRCARKHRLICEAGPDVPPQGYFDCTVEVLHKYLNDNQVLSLYVTDYTANMFMSPVGAAWCPTRLAELVMKIEVWDAAVGTASDMQTGHFYGIQNVRARIARGGLLEGKLVERKICELEETEGSCDVHLRALLERRKAWKEANEDDGHDQFGHRLIKDIEEGKYFNCVVEVLHVTYGGEFSTYIHITDYTSRAELFPLSVDESWAHGLEGCVVKIQLRENQVERAKSLEAGAYYKIRNLRLKNSTVERQFMGQLGSGDALIQMLDPNNRENNDLTELIGRKEKWKQGMLDRNPKPVRPSRNCTTIELLQKRAKCPNKYRIQGRIVDFDPIDLIDAVITHCANCKKDIPSGRRACIDCADLDHEYVRYLYQMYFHLQDDEGQLLQVSVNDQSQLFKGLKRTDLRADSAAYRALRDRMTPILGNLMEVHEDMKNDVLAIAPVTPPLTMIINSWKVDDKTAYGLWELE